MKAQERLLSQEVMKVIADMFKGESGLGAAKIAEVGYKTLFDAIESAFLHKSSKPRRVIGYGALGRVAQRIIPQLIQTDYFPTEFWDKNGDGIRIKTPDFDSLSADDTVLVFPTNPEVVAEIRSNLDKTKVTALYKSDLDLLTAESKLPKLASIVRDF